MTKQDSLTLYANGCEALATAFMKHIDPELDDDYKLVGDAYFIGSASTDYASFADGSCYYVWDTPTMYLALQKNISYEIMCEWQDWHTDDYKKPDGWVNLEVYAYRRKHNLDMNEKDFQRMLQREYYENRARNLTDGAIQANDEYMKKATEQFKKDLEKIGK